MNKQSPDPVFEKSNRLTLHYFNSLLIQMSTIWGKWEADDGRNWGFIFFLPLISTLPEVEGREAIAVIGMRGT